MDTERIPLTVPVSRERHEQRQSVPYRVGRWLWYTAQTRLRPHFENGFSLDGKNYDYCFHTAGRTWRTERAVEIPIALRALAEATGPDILEVGNVLKQYVASSHTVVDKYERAPGVVNEDIATFAGGPYDLIVSVSTLEHVGWDEYPIEPDKARLVVELLASKLKQGGRLLVTFPYNWNHYLDSDLIEGKLGFDEVQYVKRTDSLNHWQETATPDHPGLRYGYPFVGASVVVVATLTR